MPVPHLHRIAFATGLLVAATVAIADSHITDYVAARSTDINYDRNYYSGGTLDAVGAGRFTIPGSWYSVASLETGYGAMSGVASGTPPIPASGSPTNATQTSAEAAGLFQDSFHLNSASLPYGTPVTLLLTVTLNGTVARSAVNTGLPYLPKVYAGWGPGPDYPFVALQLSSSGSFVATAQWTAFVGATFGLVGVLDVRTDGLEAFQQFSQQTQAGAGNAHYYLDALTTGVTVTTDSGWNYAAPVPEPAPAALLAAGLAVLGLLSRRRALPCR